MKFVTSLLAALAFVLVSTVSAEQGPKDTVNSLLTKMKAAKSAAPIVEYIHWDTVWNEMEPFEKQQMQMNSVNSVSQLKEFYSEMLTDPAAMLNKQMETQLQNLPPEQQQMLRTQMQGMTSKVAQEMKKQQETIANTNFNLEEVSNDGKNAVVKVVSSKDGKTRESSVKLVNVDGRWYMPSFHDFGGSGKKSARANPLP